MSKKTTCCFVFCAVSTLQVHDYKSFYTFFLHELMFIHFVSPWPGTWRASKPSTNVPYLWISLNCARPKGHLTCARAAKTCVAKPAFPLKPMHPLKLPPPPLSEPEAGPAAGVEAALPWDLPWGAKLHVECWWVRRPEVFIRFVNVLIVVD